MKISVSKIQTLSNKGIVFPTYRVNSTYESRGIVSDRYKYYSLTLEHHLYFLVKKIFRLIEKNYNIKINNPRDRYLADKLKEVIGYLEQEKEFEITSRYIVFDESLHKLLLDNAYSNKTSHRENVVEIVDKNMFGGGLGLKDIWNDLFEILIYCEKEKVISKEEVITYLNIIRDLIISCGNSGLKKYKLDTSQLLIDEPTSYIINEDILADNSSLIKEYLEEIVNNNLMHNKSILKKCPDESIEEFISSYKLNRSLVLKSIKK